MISLSTIGNALRHFTEARCAICYARINADSHYRTLCTPCTNSLPWHSPEAACQLCALPIPHDNTLCGFCQAGDLPNLHRVYPAFLYHTPLSSLIISLKHKPNPSLLKDFSEAMVARLIARNSLSEIGTLSMLGQQPSLPLLTENTLTHFSSASALIPMPMYPSRLFQRGYSQSHLLSVALYRTMREAYRNNMNDADRPFVLAHHPEWVEKIRDTGSQEGRDRSERFRKMKGAFAVPGRYQPFINNTRCIIVDDVMTSGASLNALAGALKKHGAKEVSAVVIARADLAVRS